MVLWPFSVQRCLLKGSIDGFFFQGNFVTNFRLILFRA